MEEAIKWLDEALAALLIGLASAVLSGLLLVINALLNLFGV